MRSATFRIGTITTVDSPAASNTCASVQTVRGHRGQTGVKDDDVHPVFEQLLRTRRARVQAHFGHRFGLVAGERVVEVGDAADGAALGQLVQAVDGIDDVQVRREAGAVEVRAHVTQLQVARTVRDGLEVDVRDRERIGSLAVQRRAGDDRDARVRKGRRRA